MSSQQDDTRETREEVREPDGRYKPGVSGNPGGRVKGFVPFAPMLRRELLKTDRRNRSQMEKLVEKVVKLAMAGDMDAVRWIADRTDGKVAQNLNVNQEHTVNVVPWLPATTKAIQDVQDVRDVRELEGVEVGEVVEGVEGAPAESAD